MARFVLILCTVVASLLSLTRAEATLVFYYDPDTGNVSLDTAGTQSGGISLYYLYLDPSSAEFTYRQENFIRLSTSSLIHGEHEDYRIGEATFASSWHGLFTIGDILPTGLSEETWTSLYDAEGAKTDYYDINGGPGHFYPPPEFVYGSPNREFDNRWDLIDPRTLDWAATAKLIYRQATGEVVIDTSGTNGGYISAFHLKSNDAFLPEHFVAPFPIGLHETKADSLGAYMDPIEAGVYSLGNVLEPGLSETSFMSLFTRAEYWGLQGFESNNFSFDAEGQQELQLVFQAAAVPEPSSFLLVLSVGLALSLRRKVH